MLVKVRKVRKATAVHDVYTLMVPGQLLSPEVMATSLQALGVK